MSDTKRIVVFGAGGFAREVVWLLDDLRAAGQPYAFAGFVVSDTAALGPHDSRDKVVGDVAWLRANAHTVDAVAIGIGTPAARLRVGALLDADFPALEKPALVHPSVRYDAGTCVFEPGSIVCAGNIATVHVTVRRWAMVNLACTLGHESEVGAGTVLNPGINLSGGVTLEEGVLLGTGAKVLQYLRVGRGATVGAGAVVTKDVPPGETWVGVPAKKFGKG
jgi:sugar O-acyltransferase (sialic acid O-acetyltransferase NeuD family)